MSTRTPDGRLRILLLSNAVRLEKQAVQAELPDVRRDLLDAATILRRDAGQAVPWNRGLPAHTDKPRWDQR